MGKEDVAMCALISSTNTAPHWKAGIWMKKPSVRLEEVIWWKSKKWGFNQQLLRSPRLAYGLWKPVLIWLKGAASFLHLFLGHTVFHMIVFLFPPCVHTFPSPITTTSPRVSLFPSCSSSSFSTTSSPSPPLLLLSPSHSSLFLFLFFFIYYSTQTLDDSYLYPLRIPYTFYCVYSSTYYSSPLINSLFIFSIFYSSFFFLSPPLVVHFFFISVISIKIIYSEIIFAIHAHSVFKRDEFKSIKA